MARPIDANELEMFPYSEGAGTEEQIADWIEQVGLSEDDTASRARDLCWKVIEGFINVVKTQPTLAPPNEPLSLEQLREMDGEPVWVVVSQNWRESGIKSGWRLVKFHINDDRIRLYMFDTHFGASFFAEQDMGRSYWVYRRPPEGEEDA